jgi:hypothetical protein
MILIGADAEPDWKAVRRIRYVTSRVHLLGDYYRRGFITYGIYTA